MARRLRFEREGAIWHVTSRGVEHRDIYRDRDDRFYFLELLAETVGDARWLLHAYALMTNHYHLLVETPECTLSHGMKQLNERWADRFNWRHDRDGHLFQGRFHGVLVDEEKHLRELLRYVVLNPVRAGLVEHAHDFEWSNYRATAGLAPRPEWLHVDWTLAQFHEDRETAIALYREFVSNGRGVARSPEPRGVMAAVCATFGETPGALRAKTRGMGRNAFAQLACEFQMTFQQIAELLDTTEEGAVKLAARGQLLERYDRRYRAAVTRARTVVDGV